MERGLKLFQSQVRSVLIDQCVACHGGERTRGDLDLATREGLLKGGELGPAVTPFEAEQSLLIKLVRHEDEPAMPDGKPKLSDAAIASLVEWVNLGAPYDSPLVAGKQPPRKPGEVTAADRQWWSFLPLSSPTVPAAPATHPVDRFLLAKGAESGLGLAPAAERRVLIRRAYLDVLGIPPTPEAIAAFEQDRDPRAWEKVVDQLLASERYGERWARHWLDIARFAESTGFEHDYDRAGAWIYRDFVIRALNQDMPFDQFARWQIAGDEFEPDNPWALAATGFLGAGVYPTQITANEVERIRYDALDDMLATTSTAFLGLSVGCARCHDNKYDPIPSQDYYRLLTTFTTTVRSNIEVELDPVQARRDRQAWEAEHDQLLAARQQIERELEQQLPAQLPTLLQQTSDGAWQILDDLDLRSQGGALFLRQPDGSFLATGNIPARDEYTFRATTKLQHITGLRLDALADPSLPQGGPGRAANGNFALSKITLRVAPANVEQPTWREIPLVHPQVTFEQNRDSLSIAGSLDEHPHTGWAVDPQFGKDHSAVFALGTPCDEPAGIQLLVTLQFQLSDQHQIGRPRLSIITGAEPSLTADQIPTRVAAALRSARTGTPNANELRAIFEWWKTRDPRWQAASKTIADHQAQRPRFTTNILICGEGYPPLRHHTQGADFAPETHFLHRGNPDQKRGVATQAFLQVLMPPSVANDVVLSTAGQELASTADPLARWRFQPPPEAKFSGRRRTFANWLTDVDQGAGALLARVIANRVWQHHFHTGIVASANDFGKTGTLPTHPELLDWLAGELVREGWHLKSLHRLLLTSQAYQQSTRRDPARESRDPDNKLFLRRTPHRLEGEALRDCVLAVSGLLDPTMYGPGTRDENNRRRSIYFTVKRSGLMNSMVVFDQPEPLVSQGTRPTTTVAPQALLLINSPQVREAARHFATALVRETPIDRDYQPAIALAYRRALGRAPSPVESKAASNFLDAAANAYQQEGQSEPRFQALVDYAQVLFGLNEFAYEE